MTKFKYLKLTKTKRIRYLTNFKKKNTYLVFLHGFKSDLEGQKPKIFLRLLNSSLLNDSEILLKDYINLGIAVNTENGLVVPVLKNSDKLDIAEINASIKNLSEKARQKQLKTTDIEGASFTVSSLGKIGGHGFTPIINPPEVAIIGISNTRTNIRLDGKEIIEDMVLPVSLSYDHRVINGVEAGEFMVDLKIELEEKVK